MENYKILVNNEAESREAQGLFFELGCYWGIDGSKGKTYIDIKKFTHLSTFNKRLGMGYGSVNHKEITLPQLRDMVVLERNSVDDANRINHRGEPIYSSSDNIDYIYDNGKWVKSYYQAKPIEKEMKTKEYLDKDYVLRNVKQTSGDNRVPSGWIEVPEGAEIYTTHGTDKNTFYKTNGSPYLDYFNDKRWKSTEYRSINFKDEMAFFGRTVVWQRPQQPEELPFIDDEPCINHLQKTLDERQATYGCFEDVARTTEQIMEAMSSVRPNGLKDLPHPHRMALYMIASKMSRIVNGDFNHKDSWHDIQGYARLVEDLL